jgi:hypothetical protein
MNNLVVSVAALGIAFATMGCEQASRPPETPHVGAQPPQPPAPPALAGRTDQRPPERGGWRHGNSGEGAGPPYGEERVADL